AQRLVTEVAPRDVHAERERQPRLQQPPLAEVERLLEPDALERQLPLVDHEPRVAAAGAHLVEDPVERHRPARERSAERHLEDEKRGRVLSRYCDLDLPQLVAREARPADDDRAVSRAEARTVR